MLPWHAAPSCGVVWCDVQCGTLLCCDVRCCVVLRHSVSCCALLRCAVPCYAVARCAILCDFMPHSAMPYRAVLHRALLHRALLCYAAPHRAVIRRGVAVACSALESHHSSALTRLHAIALHNTQLLHVSIQSRQVPGAFEDAGFLLRAGEEREISFVGQEPFDLEQFRYGLRVRSLRDTYT